MKLTRILLLTGLIMFVQCSLQIKLFRGWGISPIIRDAASPNQVKVYQESSSPRPTEGLISMFVDAQASKKLPSNTQESPRTKPKQNMNLELLSKLEKLLPLMRSYFNEEELDTSLKSAMNLPAVIRKMLPALKLYLPKLSAKSKDSSIPSLQQTFDSLEQIAQLADM